MKEALKALDTRWRRWGRWWGCPGWGCPPMLSYGTVPGGPRWGILSICCSFTTWLCPGGWGRKRSVLGGRVWDATCTSPRGGSLVKVLLPNALKKEIHLNLFLLQANCEPGMAFGNPSLCLPYHKVSISISYFLVIFTWSIVFNVVIW